MTTSSQPPPPRLATMSTNSGLPKAPTTTTTAKAPLAPRVRTTTTPFTSTTQATRSPRPIPTSKFVDASGNAIESTGFVSASAPRTGTIEMSKKTASSTIGIGSRNVMIPRASTPAPSSPLPMAMARSLSNRNEKESQFFHASEIAKEKTSGTGTPVGARGKFFHADAIRAPSPAPGMMMAPPPGPPPPLAQGQEQGLALPGRGVRFVYANGAEEKTFGRPRGGSTAKAVPGNVAEARNLTPATSTPTSQTAYSSDSTSSLASLSPKPPRPLSSQPSLSLSPSRGTFPQSTLNIGPRISSKGAVAALSPKSTPSSRRSSMEVKSPPRHLRTTSSVEPSALANSVLMPPAEVGGQGQGIISVRVPSPTLSTTPPTPSTSVTSPSAQEIDPLAARARKDRKILDLEIHNTSLLAYNKTLERNLKKQALEIRRLKRARQQALAGIGMGLEGLEVGAETGKKRRRKKRREIEGDEADGEGEEEEVEGEEGNPRLRRRSTISSVDLDSDDDFLSASEGVEDEDEDPDAPLDPNAPPQPSTETLDPDLALHRRLLEASRALDASLKRCTLISDRMLEEGRKALAKKRMDPSEIRIGGRVLDYSDTEGENAGTETEAEGEGDTDAGEGKGVEGLNIRLGVYEDTEAEEMSEMGGDSEDSGERTETEGGGSFDEEGRSASESGGWSVSASEDGLSSAEDEGDEEGVRLAG